MTDASELDGLDPCAILDTEAERIDRFLADLPDDDPGWNAPTACPEWNRRELLAHLASAEGYHHACFDDQLGPFFTRFLDAGATDLHGFNEIGVTERADQAPSAVLAEWRTANAGARRLFRERGDADMATSVGDYPARWQAFHVASELATHADDMGVPVTPVEADERLVWRTRFSRFSLMESKPELSARAVDGATVVTAGEREITVDNATFVAAVAGRLRPEAPLDAADRVLLSTAP